MAKNIEMNHLSSDSSYEALYPKTLSQNVIMDSGENLQARIKSVEDSLTPSGTFEIGDLLYTLRDDLDSNWLLCNGSQISSSYPELSAQMVKISPLFYNKIDYTGGKASITPIYYLNGYNVCVADYYIYYNAPGSTSWVKGGLIINTSALGSTSDNSFSQEGMLYHNGYYVFMYSYRVGSWTHHAVAYSTSLTSSFNTYAFNGGGDEEGSIFYYNNKWLAFIFGDTYSSTDLATWTKINTRDSWDDYITYSGVFFNKRNNRFESHCKYYQSDRVYGDRVKYSTDGGVTWRNQDYPQTSISYYGVNLNGKAFINENGKIYVDSVLVSSIKDFNTQYIGYVPISYGGSEYFVSGVGSNIQVYKINGNSISLVHTITADNVKAMCSFCYINGVPTIISRDGSGYQSVALLPNLTQSNYNVYVKAK